MREFSVPVAATVADTENLSDMVWINAERNGSTISFRRRETTGWTDITADNFANQVLGIAKGLIAAGLMPGDRIGLMSKTRYEWSLLDYAIWAAGCVSVPIYETSSADQVSWMLTDSGAVAVIVETDEHRTLVDEVVAGISAINHVWQIEGDKGAVDELTALGSSVSDAEVHAARAQVHADDLATVIYTSGTTGRPKGCELTHRNMLAEVRSDIMAFPELMQPGQTLLMFLPMAHVLARVICVCAVYAGCTLGHTPDVRHLVDDLGEFRPDFVLAVPRVFEKVYNTAKQKAYAEGKGRIFELAENTAVRYSESLDSNGPGIGLRIAHTVFDALVYRRLRSALGGRCVAAVSGGAPLGRRLAHFFRGIGIPAFEGYGLTETTAAACVNVRGGFKVGTVGRPIAGTSIRIDDDGEVLIKGDVVFPRYWNNPSASAEALQDGWFHSGDLGELDEDGFLTITGRKKEIIVTAGGKNVSPAVLEDRLRAHPLISQCMVVGDKQPFIGALVTLDEEFLPSWLRQHGRPETLKAVDLLEDAELLADIQVAIDDANAAVSRAESIRKFRVLPTDFTEANGEMTPSLKLRRAVITAAYAKDIAAIYA